MTLWLSAALSVALLGCAAEGDNPGVYQAPDGGWPSAAVDSGGVFNGPPVGPSGVDAGAPATGGLTGGGATSGAGTGGTPGGTFGATAGGITGGGATAGGFTAGGFTAGGFTAGGFTAGGFTAGGFTAGGLGGLTGGTTGGFFGGLAGGTTAGGFFGGSLAGGFTAGGFTGGGGEPAPPLDPSVKQPSADKLPKVDGPCPTLANGTVTVAGAKVVLWVGSKPGPAYFYFHGTGTSPSEVNQALPGATAGVNTNGGMVASWDTTNNEGSNTGTIWYTGDLKGMDQLVACGIEKGIIDTGRIHVSGFSAGGLETGAALFSRSNYVASVIIYSGGKPFAGVGGLQDPSNVPAVLGAHGAKGMDSLGLDFHDGTIAAENEIVRLGGFAMDCDDGKDHIGGWFTRAGVGGKAMQFFKDHPYNTRPSPYANGLPSGYPSYCKVVTK